MTRWLSLIAFLVLFAAAPAAADCGSERLGTARVLSVDPAATPRVGRKHFPNTLPLSGREVVLTFDDGPMPGTTPRVLAALKAECAKATFFLLGRNAAAHPDLARRIRAEGHTIAHHTFSHRLLDRLTPEAADAEIARGVAAVETAAFGGRLAADAVRFFRFPGFASNPPLLAALERRRMVVFGADLWASDWNQMPPDTQLTLVLARLEQTQGGIVLFHDTRAQTAAMIPAFLRALKARSFRIVHVVPQGGGRPMSSMPPPPPAAAPARGRRG